VKVNVHIEKLVLEGIALPRAQSDRVGTAFEQELTRLLAAGGLAREVRSGFAVPSLRGGSVGIDQGSRPDNLGRAIARSVHGKIGHNRNPRNESA
jgi:hypothetical protein